MRIFWIVQCWMWGTFLCDGLPGQRPESEEVSVAVNGKKFISGFLQNNNNTDQPSDTQMILTAPLGTAKVKVYLNNNEFKKEVMVPKGQTVTVPITFKTEPKGTTKYKYPVRIESNADITVMSRNYKGNSGDKALIYPVPQLGKEYYIVTPPGEAKDQFKEFSVTSYNKPTTITIYLRGSVAFNNKNYKKGDKMTLNLMPFETYQIQSNDNLSGTRVMGNNKIAVIAGHTCAENNIGCSHVYEQLKPTNNWGTSYFVPGMSFQSKYDTALIMASKNTSITYQSGTVNVTKKVAAGDLLQINLNVSSPLSIQSTDPIQVLCYGRGGTYKDKTFGSYFKNIPDTDSFGKTYVLVGDNTSDKNLGIIIAKTSKAPEIQLDGKSPNTLVWKNFPGSGYSWAEYNYGSDSRTRTILHPTHPFGLLSFGYGINKTYGTVAPCFKVQVR